MQEYVMGREGFVRRDKKGNMSERDMHLLYRDVKKAWRDGKIGESAVEGVERQAFIRRK